MTAPVSVNSNSRSDPYADLRNNVFDTSGWTVSTSGSRSTGGVSGSKAASDFFTAGIDGGVLTENWTRFIPLGLLVVGGLVAIKLWRR